MKVIISTTNGTHNLAQCHNCDWQCDPFSDDKITNKQVAAECVKHVRKTGHKVVREVANSVSYSPL
jgi:hypothetical protein